MRFLLALLAVGLLAASGCLQSPPADRSTSAPPTQDALATAQAVRHVAGQDAGQVVSSVHGLLQATGFDSGEPTIGVDAAGHLFVTAATFKPDPLVAPAGMPRTDILRSDDGGKTWKDVSPMAAGQKTHPVTGDPLLYMDTDTSRLFDLDQIDIACDYISSTDNAGALWTPPTDACPVPVSDHMTMVTAKPATLPASPLYPKSIYFCSNQLADTQCGRSLDGGNTYQTTVPPFGSPAAGNSDQQLNCGALVGHLKAGPDGTVYLPNACDRPVLAISHDSLVSWTLVPVSPEKVEPGPDPAVTVASTGTLYYTYLGQGGFLKLVTSKDGGKTWTLPVPILAPGITASNLPTIAAGSGDRVVVAYYGTQAPGGYKQINNRTGLADTDPDPAKDNVTWDGYLALIDNATSPAPSILTVRVNPVDDPLVRGHCGPGRCKGVFDFIDVQVDRDGRPWASFVDVCQDKCVHGLEKDSTGGRGIVASLAMGPSLLDGKPLVAVHGVR